MRLSLLTLMLFACGDKEGDTAEEADAVEQQEEDTSSGEEEESPEDTGQE